VALGTPEGRLTKSSLEQSLRDADSKRRVFLNWYEKSVAARKLPDRYKAVGCAMGVGDLVDLADLILGVWAEVVKIGDERARNERELVREEFSKCEWRPWEALGEER
jgi:hypothetical protein